MNTQPSSREAAQRRRKRRLLRRGQSLVEYALTLALMALVAQGTMRTVYKSVTTVVTNLRSSLNSADDRTPTPGPSPTVRFPPDPPTLTALPVTATVTAKCTVPDLSNLQYQAAVAEWVNYGFSTGTLGKPSGKTTNFVVGSQSLTVGAPVLCTSTMTVYAKTCKVPDLANQVFSAARIGAWTSSGFFTDNLVPPNRVTDTAFPIGSQSYTANTTVDCDITMQVDPKMCTVPNLSGKTFNISGVGTAHTTWNTSFIAANLTRQNGSLDTFTVAYQSLTAGDSLYCNTAMEVWPSTCQVPNVVGSTYANAVTAWTNNGFTTALQKAANTPADFTITSQSQTATTTLDCASATMTVQPNMCTVPTMVGKLYSVAAAQWLQSPNNFVSSLGTPATVSGDFTITSQTTASGTSVACDTAVSVQPNMCTVPDLSNDNITVAQTAWGTGTSGAKFTTTLSNPFSISGSTVEVTSQQYTAGQSRACSDTMWVKPNLCVVPDLDGDLYTAATASGGSFKSVCGSATLTKDWGSTTPANRVIGATNPVAGTEIIYNGTVIAYERTCTVPNMSGMLYSAATATGGAWKNALFSSTLGRAWGATDRLIGSTNPAAGSVVACSSATVTASEKQCTVPSMVNQLVGTAQTTWTTAGFTVGNLTYGTALSGWKVTAQTPTSGAAACSTSGTLTAVSPLNVTVTVSPSSGHKNTPGDAPTISATAFNTDVPTGARGIDYVVFTISKSGTTYTIRVNAGSGTTYCAFGGSCSIWTALTASSNPARTAVPAWASALTGAYTITATAYSTDMTNIGSQVSAPVTFTILQ